MNKTLTYSFISVIILISFSFFSSVYYPILNSDDALSVLILHDYNLPQDIYFWGQNRYGTIVPLVGQFFYKGLGLSSLWSESLAHYLILILGYFAFSSFLKSNFNKIIFAIIWFCPIYYFSALVRFYSGLQYSIIAIILYLLSNYQFFTKNNNFKRCTLLFGLFILSVIAIWISDLAIITLIIITSIIGFYAYTAKELKKYYLELTFFFIGALLSLFIIYLFKQSVNIPKNHLFNLKYFNSTQEVVEAFKIIKNILINVFLFKALNFLISIYAWLLLIILCSTLFLKTTNLSSKNRKWIIILVLDGVALFFLIMISHWAFLNGVARRYFTGVYVVFWLAHLLYIEYINPSLKKTVLKIIICSATIIGFSSTLYNYKYNYPKRLASKASVVKEFEKLGKIGIIGNYWNSYGVSFINPDLIKATPHDKSEVRNYNLVDSVFAQPKLYVIKDSWLDDFPDTLKQFGRVIIKTGPEFNLGNCQVNEYLIKK